MMTQPDKRVTKVDEIPQEEHWAIFENDSYSTPGYGANDPSSTEYKINYEAYLTKDKLLEAVRIKQFGDNTYYRKPFSVAKIIPAKILVDVKLDVK